MTHNRHDERVPGAPPTAKRERSPSQPTPAAQAPPVGDSSADDHMGATEEQVSDTPAPSGEDFQDEPKQG